MEAGRNNKDVQETDPSSENASGNGPNSKDVQQANQPSEYKGRDRPDNNVRPCEELQSRSVKEEVESKYTLPKRREHQRQTGMSNLSHVMRLEGLQNYQVWATGLKGVALSNRVWKVMLDARTELRLCWYY